MLSIDLELGLKRPLGDEAPRPLETPKPLTRYDARVYDDPHCLTFYKYNVENLDKAIKEIAEGRKLAAVFKNVLCAELRAAAVENLENHQAKELYEGAEAVGRIGASLYENQFGSDREARYFATAAASREVARAVFKPYGSPIDALRAMCDELPSFNGSNLLRLKEGTAFIGLIRYLDDGARILPHTDHAGWDMPNSLGCQQIECQIAFNAHLQAATEGGDVTVYGRRPTKVEYDAYREDAPNAYALKEAFLPTRSVTINPEAGDIVLFNASLPHEVAQTSGATRYTASCFLGVDRDRRIQLFS